MNIVSKKIKNDDGTEETIVIDSTDNVKLDMNQNYCLANRSNKKENKLVKKFKGSILGTEIGVKSGGFTSVAILSTVIALATLIFMYFLWRF